MIMRRKRVRIQEVTVGHVRSQTGIRREIKEIYEEPESRRSVTWWRPQQNTRKHVQGAIASSICSVIFGSVYMNKCLTTRSKLFRLNFKTVALNPTSERHVMYVNVAICPSQNLGALSSTAQLYGVKGQDTTERWTCKEEHLNHVLAGAEYDENLGQVRRTGPKF